MPSKNWTIRKALGSDASALTECMQSAYRPYLARLDGAPLPPLEADYADEIRSSEVWIAEVGGRLVGGLVLEPHGDHLKIANVAVHADCQGNGLGRGLMDFAESEARQRGYTELRLATHALLAENVSLYRHLAWTEEARDAVRVHMIKRLE